MHIARKDTLAPGCMSGTHAAAVAVNDHALRCAAPAECCVTRSSRSVSACVSVCVHHSMLMRRQRRAPCPPVVALRRPASDPVAPCLTGARRTHQRAAAEASHGARLLAQHSHAPTPPSTHAQAVCGMCKPPHAVHTSAASKQARNKCSSEPPPRTMLCTASLLHARSAPSKCTSSGFMSARRKRGSAPCLRRVVPSTPHAPKSTDVLAKPRSSYMSVQACAGGG